MKNADLPAMPLPLGHETSEGDQGLTKREYAVIKVLAGIFSNPQCSPTSQEHFDNMADDAIRTVDTCFKKMKTKQAEGL